MASALTELIGEKVIKGKDELVDTAQFGGSEKVLGIYFSAHWCPPCRAFTPQLAQWYKKFKEGPNGDKLNIVFVSSDKDESTFKEYFDEMPWYAVPFSDRNRKGALSRKFKVSGIPTLVFVGGEDGLQITSEGRRIVMEDPEGKDFPWTPKPVFELLQGNLLTGEGEKTWEELKGTVDFVGIYFSAHWCGPCRSFTPSLIKTYNKLRASGTKLEIIFCTSDRDESAFKEYFGTMPWMALPFGDPRKNALSRIFDVSGIPTLVILDKDGKTITDKGRAAVTMDPYGKDFPWYSKPLNKLAEINGEELNEFPSMVWFIEQKAQVSETESALGPVAEKYFADCKTNGTEPAVHFFFTDPDDDSEIASSLRTFAGLPLNGQYLAIIDIPSQKKYAKEDAAKPSQEMARELLEGYLKQTLEGMPIRP